MQIPHGNGRARQQPAGLVRWIVISAAVDLALACLLAAFLWAALSLRVARLALPAGIFAYSLFMMQMLFYCATRSARNPETYAKLSALSVVTGFLMCDLTLGFALVWLRALPAWTVIEYGAPWLPITLVPLWFWIHHRAKRTSAAQRDCI